MKLTLGEYREKYSQLLSGADRTTIEQAGVVASYITNIANSMQRSAEGFNLLNVDGISLSDGKLKILATNTMDINKKLMEFFTTVEPSTEELPESLTKQLMKLAESNASTRLNLVNTKIREWSNVMEARANEFNQAVAERQKQLIELHNLSAGVDSAKIMIFNGIKDGLTFDKFFKFKEVLSGTTVVLLTEPFSVNYFDPNSKINDSFETGPFEIHINISSGLTVGVFGTSASIKSGDYIHPHISRSGQVCLGNGGAAYAEAVKMFDVKSMLRIIKAILTQYNPGSPYREFRHFKEEFEKQKKKREAILNEEALKKAFEERQTEEDWYDEELAELGAII